MTLLVVAHLKNEASAALYSALSGLAFLPDAHRIHCNIEDGGQLFQQAFGQLLKHGNGLVPHTVGYIEDVHAYPEDYRETLGYVVDSQHGTEVTNPDEDFVSRPLPGLCRDDSRIKEGVPLLLRTKPKGIVNWVLGEMIVHDQFLNCIQGDEIVGVGNVSVRGEPLPEWHRLRIKDKRDVIDEFSFFSMSCGLCGSPLVAAKHLSFARSAGPLAAPTFNSTGQGHFGKCDLLLVPHAVAAALSPRGKGPQYKGIKGVLFEPLYSRSSFRYKVARLIDSLVKETGQAVRLSEP